MRQSMEGLFAEHRVDVAFAGHVHVRTRSRCNTKSQDVLSPHLVLTIGRTITQAYERDHRTLYNKTVPEGPGPGTVFINIGDGGNREGHVPHWYPGLDGAAAPEWSAIRESSFGHGQLVLANRTHAQWTWHRTDRGEKVVSDQTWIVRTPTVAERGVRRGASARQRAGPRGDAPSAKGLVPRGGSQADQQGAAGQPAALGLRSK